LTITILKSGKAKEIMSDVKVREREERRKGRRSTRGNAEVDFSAPTPPEKRGNKKGDR
jgi:hypothetical protein